MFIRSNTYKSKEAIEINQLLFLARKALPDLVFNMANLENNPFSFPEVQTLLEGITVGGHKLSDHQQILDLHNSWSYILNSVNKNDFAINKDTCNNINKIVAKTEALVSGQFRYGQVCINGSAYYPPASDELDTIFDEKLSIIKNRCSNSIELAMEIFIFISLNKFYFYGNKITGLLIANGILLSAGEGFLNIKSKDKLEFNNLMLDLYNDYNHNANNLCDFLYNKCINRY